MLFSKGNSALMQLSDCAKSGVGNALGTISELIALHNQDSKALSAIRGLAGKGLSGEIPYAEAQELVRKESEKEVGRASLFCIRG
jgi:hypothetical protein